LGAIFLALWLGLHVFRRVKALNILCYPSL